MGMSQKTAEDDILVQSLTSMLLPDREEVGEKTCGP